MESSSGNSVYAVPEYTVQREKAWKDIPFDSASVEVSKKRKGYLAVKRVFDIVFSAVALIILCPVFLIVAVAIKLEDGGNIIYRQSRVGKDGRKIGIYKFRTMRPNADRLEDILTPEQLIEYKKEFKLDKDPRITKVGTFLRKTSIDELLQLVNVFRGEMSLIGPRPLIKEELKEKYTVEQQYMLLSVRPGLTGLWQVSGRSDCTYKSGERQKLEIYYVQNFSVHMDISILLKTIRVVLEGIGAR